jgi:hypothetical protein
MAYVQNPAGETTLQVCINGIEQEEERKKQLRTDQINLIATTTFNSVNTYNETHRKKYKYKGTQELLMYNMGCLRQGSS